MNNLTNDSLGQATLLPPAVLNGISFRGFRSMFYAVLPSESKYEHLEDVPNLVDEATFFFLLLVVLELVIANLKGQGSELFRFSDSLTSIGAGFCQQLVKIITKGIEIKMYIWFYTQFHLVDLPWDSTLTWVVTAVCVDFCYYWFHRAAHEVSLFWCFHQMHHSSEMYNMTTALRQGMFQQLTSWLFYIPLGFFLPPAVVLVHQYFNLIYQFWIHTQIIGSMGPLEYIFNCPSHHRVHHGRNPYCIDKNYAGTLIIWDRLFGTFIDEKQAEPVSYGLIHEMDSFNQLYAQLAVLQYLLFEKVPRMPTLKTKLKALLNGPGWEPGTARLGDPAEHPEVKDPRPRYPPDLRPLWHSAYVLLHFVMTFAMYMEIQVAKGHVPVIHLVCMSTMVIYSLQCFGAFFDNKSYASYTELLRCTLMLGWCRYIWVSTGLTTILTINMGIFFASTILWLVNSGNQLGHMLKTTKMD